MTNIISLTDSISTVYLQTEPLGDVSIVEPLGYPLLSPQATGRVSGQVGGSINDTALSAWEYQDVAETIRLLIQGSNLADIQSNGRVIQLLIDHAREHQRTGMGNKLYIQQSLAGEAHTWRSEVLQARLSYVNAIHQIAMLKMDASLSLTRRYFWEGLEEQLTLTSSEDIGTTVDVYNNDDVSAAATNYVLFHSPPVIAGSKGVIPSPVRIEIVNDSGVSVEWREFFLTNWVSDSATIIDPFLLGSEADAGAAYTLTTGERAAWRWTPATLTDARLTQLAGRRYRVLVAFGTGQETTGVFLRAAMEAYIGGQRVTLYRGALVAYSGEGIADLGAFPIPPGGYDTLGSDVALRVSAFRPAGSADMTVDFVMLAPAGDGLYQRIVQIGYDTPQGAGIVADGIEGKTYYDDVGRHRPITRARGLPILLFPGRYNRLRILYREAGGFVAGRRMEVRMYFRARRLDI